MLAIAWDRKVQVAKLVKSDLKVYGRWSIDSAVIGVSWLDDQVCPRSLLSVFIACISVHMVYVCFFVFVFVCVERSP